MAAERRSRLKIHPLMMLFPLMARALGGRLDAAALLAGLAVHEGAHLLAARGLGVGVTQLRLMPFGGAISMDNPYALSPGRLAAVAAAGPLGNLLALIAAAALAHWRALSPELALALGRVNLVLMLFNLLPALPLDGGRLLYAALYPRVGRETAVAAGIWAGRVVAAALAVLAVWGFFATGTFNLSFALAAVFIAASGPDERRALSGIHARAMLNALTPPGGPVPARVWAVSGNCSVGDALRAAAPDAPTLYAVYDGSRLSSFMDGRRLLEAALAGGSGITIREAAEGALTQIRPDI